ncbi:MAG: hypothetical protein O3C57_00100 [Verrucomicrobia bacterium]|nr:hypothetical protein [Verrucomicrobiota bacterium]
MKWDAELRLAKDAVLAAGELLNSTYAVDAGVQHAEGRDIKTKADREAEACILEHLQISNLPILAEESAGSESVTGLRWLVDPLDGTLNFSRGFPVSAVSIGLWENESPVLGVVYDLGQGVLYNGVVGEGAWRDDMPIRVSLTDHRTRAVLATGFPTGMDFSADVLGRFVGPTDHLLASGRLEAHLDAAVPAHVELL